MKHTAFYGLYYCWGFNVRHVAWMHTFILKCFYDNKYCMLKQSTVALASLMEIYAHVIGLTEDDFLVLGQIMLDY